MSETRAAYLQETKQHGSVLFPFNIYPCTIPRDFPSVALHWHKSMELVYVKKGRGQVQAGMRWMDAEAGDIFVLPPGMLHALRGVPDSAMEYENFMFDPEFLGSGAAACLKEAEELCGQRRIGFELGVKAAMLRFLFWMTQAQAEPLPEEHRDTERLKEVLRRVEREYAHPLTVTVMAQGCGCSASHFMRWFKQMTGNSFISYLNERRLAAAAERLRQSEDSILSIAEAVGFETLSNFNQQFKKRYGVTPRDYRRGEEPEHTGE